MEAPRQMNFDIDNIYTLVHKCEEPGFLYVCPSRAWDGFVSVTAGECVFSRIGEPDIILTNGDTVLLRRGESYTVRAKDACAYFTSAFDFSPDSSDTLARLPRSFSGGVLWLKTLEQITERWQRKSADSYMFCKIHLLRLYFELLQSNASEHLGQGDDAVELAVKFIHENFKSNFKSSEIAAYCSVSESHLRMKFLKKMGMTIVQYRDILRLNLARELLSSGLFSVKETAYELGFCDVYYFTKFFTHCTGMTPGKFRENPQSSSEHGK